MHNSDTQQNGGISFHARHHILVMCDLYLSRLEV